MPWYGFTALGVPNIPDPQVLIDTGSIIMYPFADIPDGYLRCDGGSHPIADYGNLYAFFLDNGAFFGAAPVGEFRVPNYTDNFARGLSAAGAPGDTGGDTNHSHANSVNHAHSSSGHQHQHDGHDHDTSTEHTHLYESHNHGPGTLFAAGNNQPLQLRHLANNIAVAWDAHGHNVENSTSNSSTTSSGPRNTSNQALSDPGRGTATSGVILTSGTVDSATGNNSVAADVSTDSHFPSRQAVYFLIRT